MNKIQKIAFGKVIAAQSAVFNSAVVLTQEGVSATLNNRFRKFIKEFGFVTSGGNGVMQQSLKNTEFKDLYTSVKGQSMSVFFDDKNCITILNTIRRKFGQFKFIIGVSNGEVVSQKFLEGMSKVKSDSHLYTQFKKAMLAPLSGLKTALEKLSEKSEEGSKSNIEDVEAMLDKVSLKSIGKVACKIMENFIS